MRNYFSGRNGKAINRKREDVGMVTRFYMGERTKSRHVIA
jgi:hypothetical protein